MGAHVTPTGGDWSASTVLNYNKKTSRVVGPVCFPGTSSNPIITKPLQVNAGLRHDSSPPLTPLNS